MTDVRRKPIMERISLPINRHKGEDYYERRGRNAAASVKERSVSRDLKITIKTVVGSGDEKSDVDKVVGDGGNEEMERYAKGYGNNGASFISSEDNGNVLTTGTGANEFDYEDEAANRRASDNDSSRSYELTKSKTDALSNSNGLRENKYESKFFSS